MPEEFLTPKKSLKQLEKENKKLLKKINENGMRKFLDFLENFLPKPIDKIKIWV